MHPGRRQAPGSPARLNRPEVRDGPQPQAGKLLARNGHGSSQSLTRSSLPGSGRQARTASLLRLLDVALWMLHSAKPGKIVWPWRSAPGGYCAPCQKEESPAEIAELPGRSRTATGRKFSALRSMPGRRRISRTLMTARQSRAGTLTRTRCSAATERAPRGCGTAGETRKDHPA
jgi:hypothetical protein